MDCDGQGSCEKSVQLCKWSVTLNKTSFNEFLFFGIKLLFIIEMFSDTKIHRNEILKKETYLILY